MKELRQNLKLSFSPDTDHSYRIRAENDRGQNVHGTFEIPIDLIDSHAEPLTTNRGIQNLYNIEVPHLLSDEVRGNRLFHAVMVGEVLNLFSEMRSQPLRLILHFEVPNKNSDAKAMRKLYNLPWELLYDHDFLTRDRQFSIVRTIDGKPPQLNKPIFNLRTLLVSAMPEGLPSLKLLEETKTIKRSSIPNIQLKTIQKATHADLLVSLKKHYHILHYMGHAKANANASSLALEGETGALREFSAADFARLMLGMEAKHRPLLVVLNACKGSAVRVGDHGLEGLATSLMRHGIPAVVAMRSAISDEAALIFAKNFYTALAKGQTLDEAMLLSRQAIAADEHVCDEWSAPVLYSKIPDGRLTQPKMPTTLAILLTAAMLLLSSLWQSQQRLHFRDSQWWQDHMDSSEIDTYENLLEERGFKLSNIPLGRELKLFVIDEQIHAELSWNLFGLRFSHKRFTTPWPKKPNTPKQRLLAIRHLGLNSLRTLQKDVSDLEAYYKAQSFLEQDALQAAETHLRKAITANPQLTEALATLATLLWEQGRFKESLQFAQAAHEQHPEITSYTYNLAKVLASLGRDNEAMDAFKKAGWQQGDKLALNEYGKYLQSQQSWAEAERAFLQCLIWDQNFLPARLHLGRQYLQEGRHNQVLDLCRQGLQQNSDHPISLTYLEIQLLYAQVLARQGQHDAACERVQQAREQAKQADLVVPNLDSLTELAECTSQAITHQATLMLVHWQGKVSLNTGSLQYQVYRKTRIKPQDLLELEPQSTVRLVNEADQILEISGPADWKQGMTATIKNNIPGFFAAVSERLTHSFGTFATGTLIKSRGGSLEILAPRGIILSQPRIAITGIAKRKGIRLTVEDDMGMGESIDLNPGMLSQGFIEWPWPGWVLEAGIPYTLIISHAEGSTYHDFEITAQGLPISMETLDPGIRLAYFEAQQMTGDALIEAQQLATMGGVRGLDYVNLLIDNGLLGTASTALNDLKGANFSPLEHARLAIAQGRFLYLRGQAKEARDYLLKGHQLLENHQQMEEANALYKQIQSLHLEPE